MVKGVSRQVILVRSPDEKLFEQAIFILKDGCKPISDEALLKEAGKLMRTSGARKRQGLHGAVWAFGGATITGLIWLLSALA